MAELTPENQAVTHPTPDVLLQADNANMQGIVDRHNSDVKNFYTSDLKWLMSPANSGGMAFSEAQPLVLQKLQNAPNHLWALKMDDTGRAVGFTDAGVYAPPAPVVDVPPLQSPVGAADPFVPGLYYATSTAQGMPDRTEWDMDPRGTFVLSAVVTPFGTQLWWHQTALPAAK